MGSLDQSHSLLDQTSYFVNITQYDTHGLATSYPLRRHRFEAEANIGCHEARLDWAKYVRPVEEFGNCNPVNGNFTAVVLPFCRPDRIRLVAYVLECICAQIRRLLESSPD